MRSGSPSSSPPAAEARGSASGSRSTGHLDGRRLRPQRRRRRPRVGLGRQQPVQPLLRRACTSPGTTSTSAVASISSPSPTTAARPGARRCSVNAGFIRNVQITTGPDGTVFIAGMNEGGGGLGGRARTSSTARRTAARPGPRQYRCGLPRPGPSTCGYFAAMFPSYWRHMGWGDIGAGPERDHPLRLCPARRGLRLRRRLLRPLDRQRRHLVDAAEDEHRRRHPLASGSPRCRSRRAATSSSAGTTQRNTTGNSLERLGPALGRQRRDLGNDEGDRATRSARCRCSRTRACSPATRATTTAATRNDAAHYTDLGRRAGR